MRFFGFAFVLISCTFWDLKDRVPTSLFSSSKMFFNFKYKHLSNCRRFLYYRSLLSADISVNMKTLARGEAISPLKGM